MDFYDTKMGFIFIFNDLLKLSPLARTLCHTGKGVYYIILDSICKYVKFHRDYKIESVSKMCVDVCAHFI